MEATGAPWPGAVGVSGGSDSLSLMLLLRDWAAAQRHAPPVVLCVDHALRPESRSEALQVSRWAKAAGLPVRILRHKGKPPRSDIEAAARRLRYRLMGGWAVDHDIRAVYVAHTREDQAETFLLRLARGSGVDGLAAMRPLAPFPDREFPRLALVRPLLSFDREILRDFLSSQGQPWFDDPMNADPRFARVRVRNIWPALEAAGLNAARIADAAAHLDRARAALETVSSAVLARACRPDGPAMLVDGRALAAAPRELGLRALATVLMAVAGVPYRPRFERLETLFDIIRGDALAAGRTLHGCRIAPAPRAKAVFGRMTLVVRPEENRRKSTGNRGPGAQTGF